MVFRCIVLLVFFLTLPWSALAEHKASEPVMVAHFIEVGQADATLLQFPDGAILIDAGSDDRHRDSLVSYLTEFFDEHPEMNNTLKSIIITHPHIDHTLSLPDVILKSGIKVERYIDNGRLSTAKSPNLSPHGIEHIYSVLAVPEKFEKILSFTDAMDDWSPEGRYKDDIDPIKTADIVILKGGADTDNPNNNSLVIRVDFGEASLLFTGDLQDDGIKELILRYKGTDQLDVDIYQVGHHGSYNGTTEALVNAMTPEIAVISMGRWDYGIDEQYDKDHFNTWWYGHPRKELVDLLSKGISDNRRVPITAMVFREPADPVKRKILKRIYATGWDGTVQIRATKDGKFIVSTSR